MNSMETFNPDAECLVHDQLNNELIAWKPEWAAHYREFAQPCDAPGLITWGMAYCFDGWRIERDERKNAERRVRGGILGSRRQSRYLH
jgi:hypothetical protein